MTNRKPMYFDTLKKDSLYLLTPKLGNRTGDKTLLSPMYFPRNLLEEAISGGGDFSTRQMLVSKAEDPQLVITYYKNEEGQSEEEAEASYEKRLSSLGEKLSRKEDEPA
jgi:hypothetical protein